MWAVGYFNQVFKAEEELSAFTKAYVARNTKLTKPKGKHSPVESQYPRFGNIVFIEYQPEIHRLIRLTTSYRRLITIKGKVAVCKQGEIEAIMEAENQGQFRYDYVLANNDNRLKVGQNVEIIGKSYLEGTGIITQLKNNTVRILLPDWQNELTLSSCNVRPLGL
jgi:hypothetical protein